MTKLFAVSVDGRATLEQRDAFTAYVNGLHKTIGVGFWHHLTSTWLISDPGVTLTASKLRDTVNGFMPNVSVIVLSTTSTDDWAASSPKSGHAWLYTNIRKQP